MAGSYRKVCSCWPAAGMTLCLSVSCGGFLVGSFVVVTNIKILPGCD